MYACIVTKLENNDHVGVVVLTEIPEPNYEIKIDNDYYKIKEVGQFNSNKFLELKVL